MTLLAEYDLAQPTPVIWGIEGHQEALVLICRHGRPVDTVCVKLDPLAGALTREAIERAMIEQMPVPLHVQPSGDSPSLAAAPHRPGISVAVCTRERPRSLQRCLSALQQLDYADYEIVVVDNASRDDATRQVVAEAGGRCRYVREETPGLDWARNRAVAEARHDLIAFCDDDAKASSGWLTAVVNAFADPGIAAVTGLVLPMELATRAQHLFEQYGRGMSKGLSPRTFRGTTMSPHDLIRVQELGVGANLAVRRTAFDAIGGFDTALDVGTPSQGGGDLDFLHRLLVAGQSVRYEPAAWMRHQHRRDISALRQQLYANGRAYGVYLIKTYYAGKIAAHDVRRFAWGWGRWLIGRSVRSIFRKGSLPRTHVWAELIGALHAPWAYRMTMREDARRRAAAGA